MPNYLNKKSIFDEGCGCCSKDGYQSGYVLYRCKKCTSCSECTDTMKKLDNIIEEIKMIEAQKYEITSTGRTLFPHQEKFLHDSNAKIKELECAMEGIRQEWIHKE